MIPQSAFLINSILPIQKFLGSLEQTNNIKFDNDTEFEFYQQVSNVPDLLDQETTGNKLAKDYSFSIKFLKSNSDKFIKNIVEKSSYKLFENVEITKKKLK